MKRQLLRSPSFVRAAQRIVRKYPQAPEQMRLILELLAADAFHPTLRTHKLKGEMANSWACSAGYDLRIIFTFVKQDGKQAILLQTIGTHDEVY